MERTDDAWAALGLHPGADPASVRRALRRALLRAHPDHGGDRAQLERVLAARRCLGPAAVARPGPPRPADPYRRLLVDLASHADAPPAPAPPGLAPRRLASGPGASARAFASVYRRVLQEAGPAAR